MRLIRGVVGAQETGVELRFFQETGVEPRFFNSFNSRETSVRPRLIFVIDYHDLYTGHQI